MTHSLPQTFSEKDLELYSSAFTLSDMEIFVFPHLLYSLTLANLMSPVLWEWKSDPWFKGMENRNFLQKLNRVKQFLMDRFVFNLDLDTWGLTTQEKELTRFEPFLSREAVAASNALFGYEGDKYYFDLDIRRHFGLDHYDSQVIPYWKTETVEAMEAFRFKEGYRTGAGECVSLSTLYAAALFVLAEIPLEEIFLMATPLHSQNFITEQEGVLTNNRRIVTKAMWFNGTALSAKARRALEKEQVTLVSHLSGHIHCLYPEASIDPAEYAKFQKTLSGFLESSLDSRILSHFLRSRPEYQPCFQFEFKENGKTFYVELETIYRYELSSANNFSTPSRNALLKELDSEEYSLSPQERILLNDAEARMQNGKMSLQDFENYTTSLPCFGKCPKVQDMIRDFKEFVKTEPRLPEMEGKTLRSLPALTLKPGMGRDEILSRIREAAAGEHPVAHLALYAYRDMERIHWEPFLKAALERNPVCLQGLAGKTPDSAYETLRALPPLSIYSPQRLAQPDEVWNFQRGDGAEKAFTLAAYLKSLEPETPLELEILPQKAEVRLKGKSFSFGSEKGLTGKITC